MWEATAALPEQVAAAADVGKAVVGLPGHDDIANVLVLGMGGSGLAGDLLAAIAGPFMPVPIVVVKGYEPPSFVDESTLVIAISFSGDTEETLEAASTAAAAGGRVLAVCRGGQLGQLAESWHAPILQTPGGIPMPRAGIGALAVPPLVVLERIGLFPGASSWVDLAVEQLTRRRDQLMLDGNPAERLARSIGRTLPVIYGSAELGGVAAARWKSQFNENAKTPAFANVIPELCHNEICGWGQNGDVTRQVFTLLMLRHDHEHPQVSHRFELVTDLLDEVVADHHTVQAEGEGTLAQLFDLVLFGDFVSLHLAAQDGLDPGPVPVLEEIKANLAR
jgi:glucose/mannose-6-phosphate isomerase